LTQIKRRKHHSPSTIGGFAQLSVRGTFQSQDDTRRLLTPQVFLFSSCPVSLFTGSSTFSRLQSLFKTSSLRRHHETLFNTCVCLTASPSLLCSWPATRRDHLLHSEWFYLRLHCYRWRFEWIGCCKSFVRGPYEYVSSSISSIRF
jgi:hypothetical protein